MVSNSSSRPSEEVPDKDQSLVDRYETLRKSIRNDDASAHKGEADAIIVEHLTELEHIYELVRRQHSTKIHLKDAEVFMDASEIAATNAKNIKFGDVGASITSDEMAGKLDEFLRFDLTSEPETPEETFNTRNWAKLASLYYSTSGKPMLVDSLFGPLETERRKPAARTRNVDDSTSTNLTTATQLQSLDIAGGEEQNTAHMVKNVYQTFLEKNSGSEINFFKFFINPDSFAQSVENLFLTSFLIRDARLRLYLKNNIPMVRKTDQDEQYEAQTTNLHAGHYISTLTFGSWQSAIEKFDITDLFLPDRGN